MNEKESLIVLTDMILAMAQMQATTLQLIRAIANRVYEDGDGKEAFDKLLGTMIGRMEFELDQAAAARKKVPSSDRPPSADGGVQ